MFTDVTYIVGHVHNQLEHPAVRRMLRWAELVARKGKKGRYKTLVEKKLAIFHTQYRQGKREGVILKSNPREHD
jgi:hypothetical protein